jgi:hypothetical protein
MTSLPPLDGAAALRVMMPAALAVEAVLGGEANLVDALIKARDGEAACGGGHTMSTALHELLTRARKIPPEVIAHAIARRAELQAAQRAYAEATASIKNILFPEVTS